MKRYITLVIMMAMIATVPANANLWKRLGRIAKNIAVSAGAAVLEQTCERAGYSKEESQQMTRDFCTALGADEKNVNKGLDYVNASDKYERQNVVKDYAFDVAAEVTENDYIVETFRTLTHANLEHLHYKNSPEIDKPGQVTYDSLTRVYADIMYDTYQYGKSRRAKRLAETLKMEQKLASQGVDPSMANDFASNLIAVQNSKDWTQEEKEEYFNSFGLDLDANVIAAVASENNELYSEEYLKQQEEEARKIKEAEERKKEEERKRKEAEERRIALEKLGSTSIPTYSFDNVDLAKEQMSQLDTIAEIMNKYDDIKLSIVGHTCKIGYKSINLKKGLKRAEQCKMYLVGKGIAENRIITDSKGELAPKYDNKTFLGRAQNRRVEISIIEQSSLEE